MSFLHRNLAILEERFGALNFEKNSSSVEDDLIIHEDKAVWATSKGVSICSRHNPQREAQRLVDQIGETCQLAVFLGFGLGYAVEAYVEKYPESQVIIIDHSMKGFQTALSARDLSKVLSHESLYLLVESNSHALTNLLKDLQQPQLQHIPHRVLYGQFEDYYKPMTECLNNWIKRKEVNRNTLKRFGKLWIRNFALNLPYLYKSSPLSLWKNHFKGYPAIVIAAGPSADLYWETLRLVSKKAVIIAVDTAYRSLLREGIKPHFLVVTDPQYWNSRHLDFMDCDSILISDSSTHPRVFRQQHREIYLSASPFPLAKKFETNLDHKLKSGGSVATAAWGMARLLGCSPIFMVGLDLSYPGSKTHCRGSYFEERSQYLCNRCSGVDHHNWSALHSAPAVYRNSQMEGCKVQSDQRMSIYLDWFTEEVANAKDGPFYNSSPGGAKIEGMGHSTLDELIHGEDIPQSYFHSMDQLKDSTSPDSRLDMEKKLHKLLTQLEKCSSLAERGFQLSRDLNEKFHRGIPFQEELIQLDQVDHGLKNLEDRDIAGFLIEPFLEEVLASQHEKDPEKIMENSIRLYDDMKKSLGYHYHILRKAADFFSK